MAEQIVEMCPNCETEVAVWWDIQKDGYQIFCPYCGKPMMLCSMCDRSPCNWTENGCKYSNEKYNAISNDDWIPVEERMPKENTAERYIITDTGGCIWSEMWYGYVEESDDAPCFYRWDDEMWQCLKIHAIAWRPLPDPYKPERNKA